MLYIRKMGNLIRFGRNGHDISATSYTISLADFAVWGIDFKIVVVSLFRLSIYNTFWGIFNIVSEKNKELPNCTKKGTPTFCMKQQPDSEIWSWGSDMPPCCLQFCILYFPSWLLLSFLFLEKTLKTLWDG